MTQAQALAIMKTGVNVYLSGSAGSGKTYLLNQYISYLTEHGIACSVTASTGIAATHMNGMTIHGWAGIGIRETLTEYDLDTLEEKPYLWKRFDKARVLIIDEVSMLHGHRLDMIDRVCRRFKRNNLSFGGLQVILSGDLLQLPPITKGGDTDTSALIVHSQAWEDMKPAICYLTEQHRQEDDIFLDLLNAIRSQTLNDAHYDTIASRINASLDTLYPTRLYTHNADVDGENNRELAQIQSDEKYFVMKTNGRDVLVEILKKSCLAQETLILKQGAEVMFIKNNLESGYVNGTRGIVDSFSDSGTPIVRLPNGKHIYVTEESWSIEENGSVKASLTQIPLRLAWAITIHKSQGMSLDSAEIDLSRTFAYSMGYVALSRVRTLAGVKLIGLHPDALKIDPEVFAIDQSLQKESAENEKLFNKLPASKYKDLSENFIIRMGGTLQQSKVIDTKTKKAKKIPTMMLTKELLDEGKTLDAITTTRKLTAGTILGHIEEIVSKYPETIITHLRPAESHIQAVKKAIKALPDEEKDKLTPLKVSLEKHGHNLSFEDIRLAKLFL